MDADLSVLDSNEEDCEKNEMLENDVNILLHKSKYVLIEAKSDLAVSTLHNVETENLDAENVSSISLETSDNILKDLESELDLTAYDYSTNHQQSLTEMLDDLDKTLQEDNYCDTTEENDPKLINMNSSFPEHESTLTDYSKGVHSGETIAQNQDNCNLSSDDNKLKVEDDFFTSFRAAKLNENDVYGLTKFNNDANQISMKRMSNETHPEENRIIFKKNCYSSNIGFDVVSTNTELFDTNQISSDLEKEKFDKCLKDEENKIFDFDKNVLHVKTSQETLNLNVNESDSAQSECLKQRIDETEGNISKKCKLEETSKHQDEVNKSQTEANYTKQLFDTDNHDEPTAEDLETNEDYFHWIRTQWNSAGPPNPHKDFTKRYVSESDRKTEEGNYDYSQDDYAISCVQYISNKIAGYEQKISNLRKEAANIKGWRWFDRNRLEQLSGHISELEKKIVDLKRYREELNQINMYYQCGWDANYLTKSQFKFVTAQDELLEFQEKFYNS